MHLITTINTNNLLVEVYSLNPNLEIDVAPAVLKDMTVEDICDLFFNFMGADQVDITDLTDGGPNAKRSYAVI